MRQTIFTNGKNINSTMVETILDIYKTKVITLTNDKYQRRAIFNKEYRIVFDVVDLGGVLMGDIKVQKKGCNGRYADMSVYDVDSANTFESFLEDTFDVMLDVDGKVLTEEERKVAEKAKAIAKNVGFEFNGAEGEYLVSAENDCIYTVNVEFRHNEGIEISEFYDGLICSNLSETFDCFDESDFEYDLKEAIGNVGASALSDIVSYLNDDCDECIEDTFDANNEEIGIDFKGREKSDTILVSFDKETKSIIMRDCNGDTMVTDFCNFVEEFTDFCRERFGEEYTVNWTYTAALSLA